MHVEESKILAFVSIFHETAEKGTYTYRIASKRHACYFFFTFVELLVNIPSIQTYAFWKLNASIFFTEYGDGRGGSCLFVFGVLRLFLTHKVLLTIHVAELTLRAHIFSRFLSQ